MWKFTEGAILNTWLDRPLSAAGRVALKSDDVFRPQMRLIDLKDPMFIIPNLAIHLNREVNKGTELNKQKELLPIAGVSGEGFSEHFFQGTSGGAVICPSGGDSGL